MAHGYRRGKWRGERGKLGRRGDEGGGGGGGGTVEVEGGWRWGWGRSAVRITFTGIVEESWWGGIHIFPLQMLKTAIPPLISFYGGVQLSSSSLSSSSSLESLADWNFCLDGIPVWMESLSGWNVFLTGIHVCLESLYSWNPCLDGILVWIEFLWLKSLSGWTPSLFWGPV